MKRILITGSRHHTDRELIEGAIERAVDGLRSTEVTIIAGGAPGADSIAEQYARREQFNLEVHLADWHKHGRSAGPKRNRAMVESGADVVLGFPIGPSIGTRGCMKMAREAGIEVIEYPS